MIESGVVWVTVTPPGLPATRVVLPAGTVLAMGVGVVGAARTVAEWLAPSDPGDDPRPLGQLDQCPLHGGRLAWSPGRPAAGGRCDGCGGWWRYAAGPGGALELEFRAADGDTHRSGRAAAGDDLPALVERVLAELGRQ